MYLVFLILTSICSCKQVSITPLISLQPFILTTCSTYADNMIRIGDNTTVDKQQYTSKRPCKLIANHGNTNEQKKHKVY